MMLQLRTAMVEGMEAAMPALASVSAVGGNQPLDELLRHAMQLPCVRVASLGIRQVEDHGGELKAWGQWAAFVITRDEIKPTLVRRDAQALVLIEQLMHTIVLHGGWGVGADKAERLSARNHYSGTLDEHRVQLWSVSWEQAFVLSSVDVGELEPFLSLVSRWDLPMPDHVPEAEDRVVLEQTL